MVPVRKVLNDTLPLDELKIPVFKDGTRKMVPALHKGWAEERKFIYFKTPPLPNSDGKYLLGERESWLDVVKLYNNDMEWLLNLKQHRFWSQIIYYDSTMPAIVSFLQEAVPFYALKKYFQDDDMWKMYKKTYGLIYAIVNRLITNRESEDEYMSEKHLGNLIYDNYIFTVSMMLDLCLVYGESNRSGLQSVISRALKIQPRYLDDLKDTVSVCSKVLKSVEASFGIHHDTENEPIKLTEKNKLQQRTMSLSVFEDVVIHILDTAINLRIFLDICSPACVAFHELQFETQLVKFYEYAIPEVYENLEILVNKEGCSSKYMELKTNLDIIRTELLKSYRYIVSSTINTVMEERELHSEEVTKKKLEEYISVLTDTASEKIFMRDYHSTFKVDADIDILMQICPDIDTIKFDFLMESVLSCFDTPSSQKNSYFSSEFSKTTDTKDIQPTASGHVEAPSENKKKKVTGVELDSLITEVQDILPHLQDGFIEKCLEYYDYASERVVNAVLENQLPEELQNIDTSMPRIPPEKDEESYVSRRYNIYDNDEFDIMTQDVMDTTRIIRGKRKPKYKDVKELLDDKTLIKQYQSTYAKLGLVEEDESQFNYYDDEYDDTCDDREISVPEVGDDERRPLVVPRVLRTNEDVKSSEEESGSEGDTAAVPSDQFVPNPEELRAQAERRRQMKLQNRGRRHYSGAMPQSRDVVGRPKGQGQDKTVVVNRQNKSAHKSSYANHNRRAGAQRKRQQGMFPA
ncbi:activating signal cointegrator 1 complex subunit 2 isoform X1 [Schistocerca serialis cubense]|uniref:activating signal cointegrator 1 complex subunit 2 isoform X1 n=2 Tax=Schistocerca serialis cubense TaxID=2023355 RepID=UPI00214E7713|nr:activating signal cointegrator 1 complex subunit 2 isoform X1 [Schistocerca serialis cubense]